MSDGFVGPTDLTRGDAARCCTWSGLSPFDLRLLEAFLERLEVLPDEIHTHIPIGISEKMDPAAGTDPSAAWFRKMWARRIDCALRFGDEWWLIEAKKASAHYVVGQCLCYAYWWFRDCPECELTRVIVVTDRCCSDVRCVLEFCGIDVVELDSESNGALAGRVESPGKSS
jgi:hypothetical protein